MGEEREILRYEVDATAAQREMDALQRKARETAEAIERGGDAAGFKSWRHGQEMEQRLNDPYDRSKQAQDQSQFETWRQEQRAIEQVTSAQNDAATATETLTGQKRALVGVIHLLGGSFSGIAGQLIGLVAMLTSAGAATAGWLAAAAGLTVLVQMFGNIQHAAEAAAEAQQKYNAAVREGQAGRGEQTSALAEQLQTLGARSEVTLERGGELERKLAKDYGVAGTAATNVAALAAAAGMGPEDAARLSVLMKGGADIKTPAQAAEALAQARTGGQYDTLLDEAVRYSKDAAGREVRALAKAPGNAGRAGESALSLAYRGMKGQAGGLAASGLPEDLSYEDFAALAEGRVAPLAGADTVNAAQLKKAGLTEDQARRVIPLERRSGGMVRGYVRDINDMDADQSPRSGSLLTENPAPLLSDTDRARMAMGLFPQGEGQPGQRVQGAVYNFNNRTTINQGTVYHNGAHVQRRLYRPPFFMLGSATDMDVSVPVEDQ